MVTMGFTDENGGKAKNSFYHWEAIDIVSVFWDGRRKPCVEEVVVGDENGFGREEFSFMVEEVDGLDEKTKGFFSKGRDKLVTYFVLELVQLDWKVRGVSIREMVFPGRCFVRVVEVDAVSKTFWPLRGFWYEKRSIAEDTDGVAFAFDTPGRSLSLSICKVI
jgi:hypothetical protein